MLIKSIKIVYLVFAPLPSSATAGEKSEFKKSKSHPYFFDIDIDAKLIGNGKINLNHKKILFKHFIYNESVFVGEFIYKIESGLSMEAISEKESINEKIKNLMMQKFNVKENLVEEYSVVLINNPNLSPASLIKARKFILARLIRAIDEEIDEESANEILGSRIQYSKDDMTIVDWEGAVIIAKKGDYESDLELFKVGNYQLLKYRLLDAEIDKSLEKLRENPPKNKSLLKSIVKSELEILLDFDKVDQSLLLVGDWYSAKLYRIIAKEFYLDSWKEIVKNKLDSLKTIEGTIRENLTFSWERLYDMVSIIGWAILLIGYFYLYFKDAGLL